jgi:hypothetical protein
MDLVQILNPKTNRYVKIDRDSGTIIGRKVSKGPYESIPVIKSIDYDAIKVSSDSSNERMETFGFRLPKDLGQRLTRLANMTGRTKSCYAVWALQKYLDKYEAELIEKYKNA